MLTDSNLITVPKDYDALHEATIASGFRAPSDRQTGALLRVLAATKPNGCFLELGTGTGLGASWILDGMDKASTLTSVENDRTSLSIAERFLSGDKRLKLIDSDGLDFIERARDETYDLIYADTFPGKYVGFEHSLRILRKGGIIIFDDMLPQPNWPADHAPKVFRLLREIDQLPAHDFAVLRQCWYTGHILITKKT